MSIYNLMHDERVYESQAHGFTWATESNGENENRVDE